MEVSVCVVMAAYNGEHLIRNQFESIFNQSRLPDKIVVRDDCSTDKTMQALRDIASKAPIPVLVIEGNKNLGYVRNFAEALKSADANIYFFADQDDVWDTGKIQAHLDAYKDNPSLFAVINNQRIVDADLNETGRTSLDEIEKARGTDDDFVHGCCTSFRHCLYSAAISPPPYLAHDDWVHALASACGRRKVLRKPMQSFRRHQNTTTKSAFNSTDETATKKFTHANEVIRNLQKRAAIFRETAEALESLEIEPTARAFGVRRSQTSAAQAELRAAELTGGIKNIISMFRGLISTRRSFKQTAFDLLRVILSSIRKDGLQR